MWLLDFETKSGTDIKRGHDAYFQDPDADILCLADGHWDADEPNGWYPGCGWQPEDLFKWVEAGGMVGASNSDFDQSAWEYLGEMYDFPPMRADQWYCTQLQSRVAGLPSALDKSADAAGVKHRKSRRGGELIKLMCIPPFEHTPELLAEMLDYCKQDWRVMRDVVKRTPLISREMYEHHLVNAEINTRGVKIDRAMALAAQQYAGAEQAEISAKLAEVTCGVVPGPTYHAKFTEWIMEELEIDGCDEALKMMVRYKKLKKGKPEDPNSSRKGYRRAYSSDKTVRENMLADPVALGIDPVLASALQLKQDAGGSATSKFSKMGLLADAEDDRVRGSIRLAGAPSTLRYSSLGLQLHNFRRDGFSLEHAEHYRAQMLAGDDLTDPDTGKLVMVMETLGKLVKSAILPAEGHAFVGGDWNAIESRMTAWLARDEDKLDLFRRGECPYCFAAEGIYGRPINKEDDPKERQVGKVVDLACGFLGGQGALASMAASHKIYIDEETRQEMVDSWRKRHPKVVIFGNLLHAQATRAMQRPGKWFDADRVSYLFNRADRALYCKLPDGATLLRYPEARLEMQDAPWSTEDKPAKVQNITALKAAFSKGKDESEWPRHALWRGLLLENVVQASCAVMLRDLVLLFREECVFHVHDEVILEVPIEQASEFVRELKYEMEEAPPWCRDLPLFAEPVIMARFGK